MGAVVEDKPNDIISTSNYHSLSVSRSDSPPGPMQFALNSSMLDDSFSAHPCYVPSDVDVAAVGLSLPSVRRSERSETACDASSPGSFERHDSPSQGSRIRKMSRRRTNTRSLDQAFSIVPNDAFLVESQGIRQAFLQLEEFLRGDFAGLEAARNDAKGAPLASIDPKQPTRVGQFRRVVRSKWFVGFFVFLTLYALSVPDLDQTFGDKASQHYLRISSTVVFFSFLLEVIVQSCGKRSYFFRAHFWLDLVAALSLLPDTYLLHSVLTNGNSVAAARSSRFLKTVRAASRSSRAIRLNRLVRMVRVIALVPRLANLMKQRVNEKVIDRALEKRLRRLFQCIDEDADGMIPRVSASRLLDKIWTFKASKGALRSLEGISVVITAESVSIDFVEFKDILLREGWCQRLLRKACVAELRKSDKSDRMSVERSENIGVKVALSVLGLLFILSMVQGEGSDVSLHNGMVPIDALVRSHYFNVSAGAHIPSLVQAHVRSWVNPFLGDLSTTMTRRLLYLDLNHLVFCNELAPEGNPCDQNVGDAAFWGWRTSLHKVDHYVASSSLRDQDVVTVRIAPNVNDINVQSMNDEEFNRGILSLAVVNGESEVREEGRVSMITTGVVLFCILGGIIALTRDLSSLSLNLLKPLQELSDELESIVYLQLAGCGSDKATTDLDAAPIVDEKELGVVSEIRLIRRTFENMKLAIKSWGRYVPWPVVHLLLHTTVEATLDVQEKEVSVFFSDIASFTTIVENLPSERSLFLLSRYFSDMSSIVDANGGIVIEFIGDAILSVYGAPRLNPNHPREAVMSALHMIAALEKINTWCTEEDLPNIQVRFGVHTGRFLVGNMGFRSRMKYGIVGDEVQIPARLEELNKTYGTQVLISFSAWKRISEDPGFEDDFITRPIDWIQLSTQLSSGPELIYEVVSCRSYKSKKKSLRFAMARHDLAMSMYRELDFSGAASIFKQVTILMRDITSEEDVASTIMMQRCEAYAESPPGLDWAGVWDGPMSKLG
eukprot:TRINITY_DN28117_c0_g1_i1.p1 TRINITY_DN28117_c0_g1~~TRINITY_DN28117_c0_g1_i1.p1  ORF type:complete len:1006 (-),score=139.02 TRINITY_DN28117_c0_g1_i1:212-3229(-)